MREETAPKSGAKCADTVGISSELLARKVFEYSFSTFASLPAAIALRKDLSQMLSSALPCATLALLPTVHTIAASS